MHPIKHQAELNYPNLKNQTVHLVLGMASEPELRRLLDDRMQTVASSDVGVECLRSAISLLGLPTTALGACRSSFNADRDEAEEDKWGKGMEGDGRELSSGGVAVVIVEVTSKASLDSYAVEVWTERSADHSSVDRGHSGHGRRQAHLWPERWLS